LGLLFKEKDRMEKKLERASRRDAKAYRELTKLSLPYASSSSSSSRNRDQRGYGGGGDDDYGATRQSSRRAATKVDYTYSSYEEALKDALKY
jgi:hypothetical protein